MEIKYDKAALLEYMDQVGDVGEQMQRRQDESINQFNSCKAQYNRIYTKLEELVRRAYNRLEEAESMRRSADIEYEAARSAVDSAEDDSDYNAAMSRLHRAEAMQAAADAEYERAYAEYTKACDDQRALSDLWESSAPVLESHAQRVEDDMVSFSRLVTNGNSDMGEYMSIMDKAQSSLYGDSGESAGSGGITTAARTQGLGFGGGEQTSGLAFKSALGNSIGIVAGADGLKNISMSIGGNTQTFPNTKSGLAKAHRSALKSGDAQLASYTGKMFSEGALLNDLGASQTNNGGTFSANNNQIAAAMVRDGFVRSADFGKLDNKTAQDIQKSVAETLKMFPDIDLRFVGSVQSRNQRIEKGLEEMYLDIYRSHYPSASDEDLMPFVKQEVAEDMKRYEPQERTIAQSLFLANPQTRGDKVVADLNGISINERYGANYNYFTNVRKSDVMAKWKPEGCNTPRATVDHELGHQIARLTDAHNDGAIQKMYSDFMNLNGTQRGEALSGYAGESIHEFIAEGWSEYRNNPNCRSLATNISKRLFELYKKTP